MIITYSLSLLQYSQYTLLFILLYFFTREIERGEREREKGGKREIERGGGEREEGRESERGESERDSKILKEKTIIRNLVFL